MVLRSRAWKSSNRGRDAAHEVMTWVRDMLDLDAEAVVSVASHACGDPDCGDAAATILLMRPGQPTTSIRLRKSLDVISKADVRVALQPIIGGYPQRGHRTVTAD
jgi:hypothetical protein